MKNAVCPLEFEALARRNKKEWLLEFSPRKARKPRKVVWFVPPCSRRSRCSRFIEFKRSVRCNSDEKITAKRAKTANKKGSVRCIFNRETRESREKFVWSASPCSYPSLCSRFIEFKGSVRSISNRERRENREQKRSVPCRSEAVPGGKERKVKRSVLCSVWPS